MILILKMSIKKFFSYIQSLLLLISSFMKINNVHSKYNSCVEWAYLTTGSMKRSLVFNRVIVYPKINFHQNTAVDHLSKQYSPDCTCLVPNSTP